METMLRTGSLLLARCTTMALSMHLRQLLHSRRYRNRLTIRSHRRVIDHGDNIRLCILVYAAIVIANNRRELQSENERVAAT